jgi:hypothetical protein
MLAIPSNKFIINKNMSWGEMCLEATLQLCKEASAESFFFFGGIGV